MCERAVKLQHYIDTWLEQEIALKVGHARSTSTASNDTIADYRDLKKLRLEKTEWEHLNAITQMLERFKRATAFLSENEKPQVPYIWLMYNRLFDFLDQIKVDIGVNLDVADPTTWPDVVKAAAERGRQKLSKYYSRTYDEQGFLFNCGTILDPTQKLNAYEVCLSHLVITTDTKQVLRTNVGTLTTSTFTASNSLNTSTDTTIKKPECQHLRLSASQDEPLATSGFVNQHL